MALSLFVIIFVACMTWMWCNQGIFSAFIHLVLTIIAGVLAFALWEPFVYGFLLGRMPEQAWGLGLVIPFGMILLALRTVFDKLVPATLNFHNIVDTVGGGVLGFCSGVLTAGIIVIGAQMAGLPSIVGYQGYKVDESGQEVRNQSILIPVDSVAGGFFTMLSGGSMSPILHDEGLDRLYPNLAARASLYHQSPFWDQGLESSYRALPPANVKIVEGETGLGELDNPPAVLVSAGVPKAEGKKTVIIGVEITLQSPETKTVAADAGGQFRISRAQVGLAAENASGGINIHHPVGYLQEGEYRAITAQGDFAYSGSATQVIHHWVFQVPQGQKPLYLTLKQTRIELSTVKVCTDAGPFAALLGSGAVVEVPPENGGNGSADEPEDVDSVAVVSPSLMTSMNTNRLDRLKVNLKEENGTNCIVSGTDRYVPGKDDRGTSGKLTVSRICHSNNERVVRVNLGKRDPQSLLGKVINFASQLAAPVLKTASGKEYGCIGFVRREGSATYFSIDPSNKITSLAQLKLGSASETAEVYLFFHVDVGETVTSFELKNAPTFQNVQLSLEVK